MDGRLRATFRALCDDGATRRAVIIPLSEVRPVGHEESGDTVAGDASLEYATTPVTLFCPRRRGGDAPRLGPRLHEIARD